MNRYRGNIRKIVLLLLAAAALWFVATAATAAQIGILSPAHEQTIHDNAGNVSVTLHVEAGNAQRVRLLLDGEPAVPDGMRTHIDLHDIDRGEHTLEALLLDKDGELLAASGPVTFFMWRASRNFPARQ